MSDSGSPPASTGSSTTQNISIKTDPRTVDQIHNNPLDDYIDCIYNVSLGLVSWGAISKLQKSPGQDVALSSGDTIVFASTAEARTSTNYTGDYYNIKSFTFTNFVGHIPQNPMIAVICDGKIKIVQPYGFSFREDIDTMAQTLGYPLTTPLNFVYRLEIWFSGYKPTGQWVDRIPIPVSASKSGLSSIVYYIAITSVEARVTPIGTEYDLSFQTASHLAVRAEMINMHKDNIGAMKDKPTVGYAQGTSFGKFIANLAEALRRQVGADTQNLIDVEYQFFGPDWLFNDTFNDTGTVDFSNGVSFNPGTGTYALTGNNVDILTLLNNVMDELKLVRQLHLREDDTGFKEPGCLWTVRTNILEVSGANDQINNYGKYILQYFIEPVLSYRSRMTETPERNDKVEYENQLARANGMNNYGMIVRVYDYLFTEDNSEIIDFQFLYKNFYYESFPYPSMPDNTNVGAGHNTADDTYNSNTFMGTPLAGTSAATPPFVFTTSSSSTSLATVLGIPVPNQSNSNQFQPGAIHGAMNRSATLPVSQNVHMNESKAQKYLRGKDQYMRYDMLNAQLTVRFDPVWLLNPYMSGSDFTATVSGNSNIYAHTDRVVFVKAYRPNQKNYMNPDFSNVSPSRAPILGGYYQVIQILNEFNGGKMTQKLNMYKYPHMNYFNSTSDQAPSSGVSSGGATTTGSPAATSAVSGSPDPTGPTLSTTV